MMDGSGLSVADAIALEGRNNCCNNDGLFGGDGDQTEAVWFCIIKHNITIRVLEIASFLFVLIYYIYYYK